jgi:hypothetical protein
VKPRPDGRFNVYVSALPGGKPLKSTANTEADAHDMVADFVAGIEPNSRAAAAGERATRASARPSTIGAAPAVHIHKQPKRKGAYIAGPGRGNHQKVRDSVLGAVLRSAEKLTTELEAEHSSAAKQVELNSECGRLRLMIKNAAEREAKGALVDPGVATVLHRIIELQRPSRSGSSARTQRRIQLDVKDLLRQYDEDVQVLVLEGVLADLRGTKSRQQLTSEDSARQSIIDSLVHALSVLRSRNKGRYKHADRVTHDSILGCALSQVPKGGLAAAARVLGLNDRHAAHKMKSMWDAYEAGDRDTVYEEQEAASSAYPTEWADFIEDMWLDPDFGFVRLSERACDDIRNPKNKSDPTLHRVRWRESRYEDVLNGDCENRGMLTRGTEKFGAGFHLSMKTMIALEPFNVRKPGEETCVCVHHLKWAKLIQSLGLQRKRLKLSEDECQCSNKTQNAHQARHMLMCDRENEDKFAQRDCIANRCSECPGVDALRMCEAEERASEFVEFTREKWKKDKLTDGSEREGFDFFKVKSTFEELYADIEKYAPLIIEHHDLAVMQDYDWAVYSTSKNVVKWSIFKQVLIC